MKMEFKTFEYEHKGYRFTLKTQANGQKAGNGTI